MWRNKEGLNFAFCEIQPEAQTCTSNYILSLNTCRASSLMRVFPLCWVKYDHRLFLDLKKEDVYLEEQYFDVIASKTENGLRKVPIADKVLPFYQAWYEGSKCEYLLHTPDQKHFDYRNHYDSHFTP